MKSSRHCASRRCDRRHVAQGWAAVAQREQRDSQHDERHPDLGAVIGKVPLGARERLRPEARRRHRSRVDETLSVDRLQNFDRMS